MTNYKTLVVPFDFSAHSRSALATAVDLATKLGSDLHLVHVIQPPSYAYAYGYVGGMAGISGQPPIDMARIREDVVKALNEVCRSVEGFRGKIEAHVVESSAIASAICESARDLDASMIVMGTHGRTGLAHAFLGSVAERTLRGAACPVLTIQSPDEVDVGAN
jgi:nucleotide-binding universal stress UspA family protein